MEDFRNEIASCVNALNKGVLILFPSELGWGMGCDATDENGVKRLLDLLGRPEHSVIFCLAGNDAMLERHVTQVPEVAWDIMDLGTKPTGIVYDQPRGLAEELNLGDHTLAFLVVKDAFCRNLVSRFKKPLLFIPVGKSDGPTPSSFGEIQEGVLKAMAYVVNLHRDDRQGVPFSVIALGNDGMVKVIRE